MLQLNYVTLHWMIDGHNSLFWDIVFEMWCETDQNSAGKEVSSVTDSPRLSKPQRERSKNRHTLKLLLVPTLLYSIVKNRIISLHFCCKLSPNQCYKVTPNGLLLPALSTIVCSWVLLKKTRWLWQKDWVNWALQFRLGSWGEQTPSRTRKFFDISPSEHPTRAHPVRCCQSVPGSFRFSLELTYISNSWDAAGRSCVLVSLSLLGVRMEYLCRLCIPELQAL